MNSARTMQWPLENNVMMVWTTHMQTWNIKAQRVLESILRIYPGAQVQVYSNTLPKSFFFRFVRAGYNVSVIPFNVTALISNSSLPGARWATNISHWQKFPHFYAHHADFVRFLLLYRYGGLYLDTDSLFLRPLHVWPQIALGTERCDSNKLTFCFPINFNNETTDAEQQYYLPIGVLLLPAGHSLMRHALKFFDTSYNPDVWPCGTAFLSNAYTTLQDASLNQYLLPPKAFYPVSWQNISYYLQGKKEELEMIANTSYAFHFWNKMTQSRDIRKGSLLDRALSLVSISERIECPAQTFGPSCLECSLCGPKTRRCSDGLYGRGCLCQAGNKGLFCDTPLKTGPNLMSDDYALSPSALAEKWKGNGMNITFINKEITVILSGPDVDKYALRSFQIVSTSIAVSACASGFNLSAPSDGMDFALLLDAFTEQGLAETTFEPFSVTEHTLCVDIHLRHRLPIQWLNMYFKLNVKDASASFFNLTITEVSDFHSVN